MALIDRIRKWFAKKPENKVKQVEVPEEKAESEMFIESDATHSDNNPVEPEPLPPIEDETFGRLEGSDDGYGWKGNVMLGPDRQVKMSIWPDDGYDEKDYIKAARSLFLLMKDNEYKILDQVAEKMLDLANDWEEDAAANDEKEFVPLDKEAFIARITLESIVGYGNGSGTLYYNDGDIFWGHVIDVSINAQGDVTSADIAG